MTCIAYKDGKIAVDGLMTIGKMVSGDNRDKKYDFDGGWLFYSGPDAALDAIQQIDDIESLLKQDIGESWVGIYVKDKSMRIIGANPGELPTTYVWRDMETPIAFGTGGDFAMGAMHSGKSAKEAVEITSKLVTSVGGTIREYSLEDL